MVLNQTDESLVYLAVERELSNRLDPVLTLTVTPEQGGLISPGDSDELEDADIMGYKDGDDVRLFLYVVREDEADLEGLLTVTDDQLIERHFRIEIDADALR